MHTVQIECPHCKHKFDEELKDVTEYKMETPYLTTADCPNCEKEFSFSWSWDITINVNVKTTEEHIKQLRQLLEWTKSKLATCENAELFFCRNEIKHLEADIEEAENYLLLNNNGG